MPLLIIGECFSYFLRTLRETLQFRRHLTLVGSDNESRHLKPFIENRSGDDIRVTEEANLGSEPYADAVAGSNQHHHRFMAGNVLRDDR